MSQARYDKPEQRNSVIAARALRKSIGPTRILRDVSLRVEAGEIYGLIGPSGSGKSTTVHVLCGHLSIDAGVASVFGEQPTRLSRAARQRIGYMPQHFALYPDLSIAQNVQFAAGLYGLTGAQCEARLRLVLELVDLWEARRRRARAASGGMQRRAALAAALVHDPELLFADEPTANLDPILRARIWDNFRERSAQGHTLLITTQYVDEAERCDRVGLMFEGALIAEGRPETLRREAFGGDVVDVVVANPRPDYAAALSAIATVQQTHELPERPLRLVVERADQAIPQLLAALSDAGARVQSIAQYQPSFDEVFIRLIERYQAAQPPAGQVDGGAGDARPDPDDPA